MADNSITTIFGTPSDAAAGLTVVERYLQKKYLKEREYRTVLANSQYGTKHTIPRMAGQYIKFTKRQKGRMPEKGVEGVDPESGVTLGYDQFETPIEWIKEWGSLTMEAGATSWLSLANDIRVITREALTRNLHQLVQDAFMVGRYQPGHRNSSGATTGSGAYYHFRTTAEATVTLYGISFTFKKAPRYYTNAKTAFAQMEPGDHHTMEMYKSVKTRLLNSGAPRINGGVICVIDDGIKNDLTRDDRYFEAAIRSARKSDMIFLGQIADYEGIHWVLQDEPFKLLLGGNKDTYNSTGEVHTAHMFGMDAFSYVRLGGENAGTPTFKVQDISKTGSLTTFGYSVPFQAQILDDTWCANIIGPVREHQGNVGAEA